MRRFRAPDRAAGRRFLLAGVLTTMLLSHMPSDRHIRRRGRGISMASMGAPSMEAPGDCAMKRRTGRLVWVTVRRRRNIG